MPDAIMYHILCFGSCLLVACKVGLGHQGESPLNLVVLHLEVILLLASTLIEVSGVMVVVCKRRVAGGDTLGHL